MCCACTVESMLRLGVEEEQIHLYDDDHNVRINEPTDTQMDAVRMFVSYTPRLAETHPDEPGTRE